jgi:hypothetical protein
MGPRQLDLAQAPPISVPLRFFLTAPLFAIAAAGVVAFHGGSMFASRFMPATLAATHLLALGCLSMTMAGALMQIVPVLAGAPIARPRMIAGIVHPALTLGSLMLAAAFLAGAERLFVAAAVLLGVAFAVLIAAVVHAMLRARAKDRTARALHLAMAALGVTVVLGAGLGLRRVFGAALPIASLADLHPAWALFGWVGLLIAAVAERVVPMFQLTPAYPSWLVRRFGFALLGGLLVWTVARQAAVPLIGDIAAGALAMLYVAFALVTLRLQRRRRRRRIDVNVLFWRLGMVLAIAAALAFATAATGVLPARAVLVVGVLAIVGAALSLVNGMLYRIVPFIAWFHLYTLAGASPGMPNVKDYLTESRQRAQFALHAAAVVLLVVALVLPDVAARIAALAFMTSALAWQANLVAIVRVYRQRARALASAQPAQG